MAKCFLLLIVLLFLGSNLSFAQVGCTSAYFETSLLREGYTYSPSLTVLLGGNVVMAEYSNTSLFSLIKINTSGDTLWNKTYQVAGGASDQWKQVTRLDRDGTLLCALSGNQLVKIDTNGVVIWAKQIQFNGVQVLYDLQILENGDKLVFYQADDWGRSILARLSADLSTVKWCKYFHFYSGGFTNVIVNNGEVVFGGSAITDETSITEDPFIAAVDEATGALRTFHYFHSDEFSGGLGKLYTCGNGYLATANFSYPTDGSHSYVRFNSDLSIRAVKSFASPDPFAISDATFTFAPEPDGSFYIAYGGSFNLAFGYVNNQDSLMYVKDMPGNYSYPSDIKQNVDGLYITGNENFYGVGTQTIGSSIYLIKCDFAGSPGDCQLEQIPSLSLLGHFLPEGVNTMDVADSNLTLLPVVATLVSFPLQAGKSCIKEATCNSIRIKGNKGVCDTSPVIFTGSKNAGCGAFVNWSANAKEGYTFTSLNDSTLSAVFTRNGVYVIYGQFNVPCGGKVIDSMKVSVNLSTQLNLGSDTFLCSNQLLLHAGNQFQSYQWQDGASDSVYAVTRAGKYFVTAKDYCNNVWSDTLLVSQGPLYPFGAGNDTVICNHDTIALSATPGFLNYQWSPSYHTLSATGATTKVFPDKDTSYTVQAEKPVGCFVYDTVHIAVITSPAIRLGNDTSFCEGQSKLLNAGGGFAKYLWNTGDTTQHITVKRAGTYTVRAKAGFCFSTDTFSVTSVFPLPKTKLTDTTVCVNNSITLQAEPGFISYLWQNNTHLSQYTTTEAGRYWVTVTDNNGCSATDTAVVAGPAPLPDHFLATDTLICSYDTLMLQPTAPFTSYVWSNGETTGKIRITNAGTYWLQVMDANGCINKNYITVGEKECKNEIYFPSAFTPNSDGLNDLFRPKVLGNIEQFHLLIYSRWGQKIFETSDWQNGWNGHVNASLQDTGTYIWIATYKLKNKAASVVKGTVVLIK